MVATAWVSYCSNPIPYQKISGGKPARRCDWAKVKLTAHFNGRMENLGPIVQDEQGTTDVDLDRVTLCNGVLEALLDVRERR